MRAGSSGLPATILPTPPCILRARTVATTTAASAEPRRPALDVEELLGAHVGAEAGLGDDDVGGGEGDPVGDDRAVAVGDVREWPAVDVGGTALERLEQVRLDRVAQEDRHRAGHAQVLGRDGRARAIRSDDDPAQPGAQVEQVLREGQDRHHLGGDGDHVLALARDPVLPAPEPDDHPPDRAIADVHDPRPADREGVDAERVPMVEVVVEEGRGEVVGGADGVDVAGQVEVEVLHRDDLAVAAAGRPSLDPEDRAERGLADRDRRLRPIRLRPWASPTVVVVLPSPSGVGVIAVTTTYFPRGRSARRARRQPGSPWLSSARTAPARGPKPKVGGDVADGPGRDGAGDLEVGREAHRADSTGGVGAIERDPRATRPSAWFRAARMRWVSRIAFVSGPTPPGTGVIAEATGAAESVDVADDAAARTLMPTSTTTAPGRSISPVTSPGRPTATITISASRTSARQVGRARVADRHRGVLPEEQERRGLAHDVGTAHHDRALAGELDPGALEDLHRRVRGSGQEALVAECQQARVEGMNAVDVLGRVEHVDHGAEGDRGRQRHLDDDPGDCRVAVEPADRGRHLVGAGVLRELHEPVHDPHRPASVEDLVQVDGRWRVAADDHDRQGRREPVHIAKGDDIGGHGLAHVGRDRAATQEPWTGGRPAHDLLHRHAARCAVTREAARAPALEAPRAPRTRASIPLGPRPPRGASRRARPARPPATRRRPQADSP